MKEFKGSKGDWGWEENSASQIDGSTCIEVRGDSTQIAYLQSFSGWGSDHDRNATIANANLIAAAPDLLDALLSIVNMEYQPKDDESDKVYLKARAAISKALGGRVMGNLDNGGRAFPCDSIVERDDNGHMHGKEVSSAGMTLRDYFAAKAMASMCQVLGGHDPHSAACQAYDYADAMLEARKK